MRVCPHRQTRLRRVPLLQDSGVHALAHAVDPELMARATHRLDVGGQLDHAEILRTEVQDHVPPRMLEREVEKALARANKAFERRRCLDRLIDVRDEGAVCLAHHIG
ncbi:MAG TPA: hypothetical protein DCF71_08995 [Gemmatimonadetes bacterium]|nr:hypothetical protein [Gemmatimonadota bacterium]